MSIFHTVYNETYIHNMVHGRMVNISYKSKKCLRQAPKNWVVVEGTHEPIIDPECRCWSAAANTPGAEPITSC